MAAGQGITVSGNGFNLFKMIAHYNDAKSKADGDPDKIIPILKRSYATILGDDKRAIDDAVGATMIIGQISKSDKNKLSIPA